MSKKWTIDQQKAIDYESTDSNNKIVLASAGSGKTSVMVEKILNHIDNFGSVRRIIVSTFTNNSATDMKEKIVEELKRRIRDNTTNQKLANHYREQLADLPLANIGTIDSFCKSLVEKHYEEIKASPQLDLLSPSETDNLLRESIQEVILEKLSEENPEEEFKNLLKDYTSGRRFDAIYKTIEEVYNFLSALPSEEEKIEEMMDDVNSSIMEARAINWYMRDIKDKLSIAIERANEAMVSEGESFENEEIEIFIEIAKKIINAPNTLKAFCEVLDNNDKINIENFTKKLNDIRDPLNKYLEVFTDYDEVEKIELEGRRRAKALLCLTKECLDRFHENKQDEGVMTFSDIERAALKILSSDTEPDGRSEVAKDLRNDIDYIFIDEYQDINLLQNRIYELISNDNIFMVGDIKQSIYAFRHSMPDIMLGVREDISSGSMPGQAINFNHNFRSHESILGFVNGVFASLMTSGFGQIDYKNDAMMETVLEWPEKEGVVTVKKVGKDEKAPAILSGIYSVPRAERMDSIVERMETSWVARAIQYIVGNETIYDIKEGKERPVEYRDIALIQRTNSPTDKFTAEFQRRGIPYETVGAKEGLKTQDIDLFNSLIKVLSNPKQDYPLLVVMQSFFGKFTIDDIIDLRQNREKGEGLYESLLEASVRGNEKAKSLLSFIERSRKQAYLESIPDLMLSIATETGYDAEMLSSLDERISSFNAYVSYLRDKDFAKNIDSYLVWVESGSDIEVKLPSAGVNAVRIGTIHGSKGLEYPIVFLTSTHINPRQGSGAKGSPVIVTDKDLGIGFKVLKQNKALVNSLSYLAIERKKAFLEKEEGLRVLYVALTRAKNRLFITATKEDEGPKAISKYPWEINTYIDLIDYASQYSEVVNEAYDNFNPPEDDQIVSHYEIPKIDYEKNDLKLTFPQYKYPGATMIGNKYTVTEIAEAKYIEREADGGKIELIPGLVPISKEEGIQYHAIMQYIDFNKSSKDEVTKQIDDMVSNELLGRNVDRQKINDNIIYKALQNPLFRQIANMHVLKEQEFQLYIPHKGISPGSNVEDKVLVQGIIDLIAYNDKDEAILVDYKYSSSTLGEIKARYFEQINIYAMAIERVLKKKLVKKAIYLIERDEIVEL